MNLNHYRFRAEWTIGATASTVYAALQDLDHYPKWWREIRYATRSSHDTYEITVRSVLPYSLNFFVKELRRDELGHVLEASMSGDLDGFSRWTVVERHHDVLVIFEEEVEARKSLLRSLAFVAKPAFSANHFLMMRNGEKGLRKYLAESSVPGL